MFFRKILVRIKLPQLLNAVLAVLASQIAGRVINVLCTMFAVQVLGVQHKAVSVAAAVGSIGAGLPGIVIQLLFIPALVVTLLKILERHAAGFDGK